MVTIFDWLKSQVTSAKRFDWFREGYKFLNFRAGFYLKWSKTKWEEVLISWMSGKSFEFVEPRDEIEEVKGREDWQIFDLEALLLKRGLIPEFVGGNDSLYDILLRRMQKQLLYSVNVPPRVQTSMTFGGLMNCRRMLLQDVECRNYAKSNFGQLVIWSFMLPTTHPCKLFITSDVLL